MLKNNKLSSRGFWTILGVMILTTFLLAGLLGYIFEAIMYFLTIRFF